MICIRPSGLFMNDHCIWHFYSVIVVTFSMNGSARLEMINSSISSLYIFFYFMLQKCQHNSRANVIDEEVAQKNLNAHPKVFIWLQLLFFGTLMGQTNLFMSTENSSLNYSAIVCYFLFFEKLHIFMGKYFKYFLLQKYFNYFFFFETDKDIFILYSNMNKLPFFIKNLSTFIRRQTSLIEAQIVKMDCFWNLFNYKNY